jgi:hypothetical protein
LDLRALALLRIFYGAIVVIDILIRATDLLAHYSDRGLAPRDFILQNYQDAWQWSIYLAHGHPLVVGALMAVAAGAGCCLALGYRTRLSTLICWIHLVSLHNRNSLVLDGGDPYLRVVMFWALFLPWGARWSLDAWRTRQLPPKGWLDCPGLALLLQIGSVYFFAACLKSGIEWRVEGSATYYALMLDQLTTPLAPWLLASPALMKALTFAVLYFEFAVAFFLLGPPRLRWAACLGLSAMHLGFGLSLHLGVFCLVGMLTPISLWPSRVMDRMENSPLFQRVSRTSQRWLSTTSVRENTQLATDPRTRVVVTGLAGLMVGWNLATLPGRQLPPGYPRPLMMLLGLDQTWDMFAPKPLVEDGWYVIDGNLVNGRHVDLFRDGADVVWSKPARVASTYRNARWRKYMMNLWSQKHSACRLPFGRYLTRQWNENHSRLEQVASFEICFMLERTLPNGTSAAVEKVVIWRHLCFDPKP